MTTLKLDINLEATDMGSNQDEIADYIMSSEQWLNYVNKVNALEIPASNESDSIPCDEWFDAQDFHPDDLIQEACEKLGWHSVPQVGGLMMNFYKA